MSDATHRSFEVSEIEHDCHVLNPSDVCSIVQMLNDLVALDETTRVKKIQLMQCLADLTHTDCWVWTLVSPTKVGEKILAVDVLHGGFDDARFACYLETMEHPQMGELNAPFLEALSKNGKHVTVLRQQFDLEDKFPLMEVYDLWKKLNIAPLVLSASLLDDGAISISAFYRNFDRELYTTRDARILQLALSHADWFHQSEAQLAKDTNPLNIKNLSPRLRTVLNLMLAGLSRKEIAAELDISVNTVAGYVKGLYRFFDVHSQTELLKKFRDGE